MKGFLKPRIPPLGAVSLAAQLGIERVGDMVDVADGEPSVLQAETDRALRKLMRVIAVRFLAVLDAIEPLLLGSSHELAVDEQSSGRFMIHRVNSKDIHHSALLLSY